MGRFLPIFQWTEILESTCVFRLSSKVETCYYFLECSTFWWRVFRTQSLTIEVISGLEWVCFCSSRWQQWNSHSQCSSMSLLVVLHILPGLIVSWLHYYTSPKFYWLRPSSPLRHLGSVFLIDTAIIVLCCQIARRINSFWASIRAYSTQPLQLVVLARIVQIFVIILRIVLHRFSVIYVSLLNANRR